MRLRRQFVIIIAVLVALMVLIALLGWQNIQLEASLHANAAKTNAVIARIVKDEQQTNAQAPALETVRAELQQELAALQNTARTQMDASSAALTEQLANLQNQLDEKQHIAIAQATAEAVASAVASVPRDALFAWLELQQAMREGAPFNAQLNTLLALSPEDIQQSDAATNLRAIASAPAATRGMLQATLVTAIAQQPEAQTKPANAMPISSEVGVMARMERLLGEHVRVAKIDDAARDALAAQLNAHATHGELMAAARLIENNPNSWPELHAWHDEHARAEQARAALRAFAAQLHDAEGQR